MFQLILDQDYLNPLPAVDTSGFGNHGQVIQLAHSPDGRQPNSGAMEFSTAGSAVRIARGPSWLEVGAVAVEAWLLVSRPAGHRRNIIEGDGSFALYVDSDNSVVASVFGLIDGASAPGWHATSSSSHSPSGTPYTLDANAWTKVVFHHDGVSSVRLFINDELAGARTDFLTGVVSVGPAGIVVGNWTLSEQYAFLGSIDRVRVFKRDKYAPVDEFVRRPAGAEASDAWEELWQCLAGELNADKVHLFKEIMRNWRELERALARSLHVADPADVQRFRELIATYRRNWRANTIAGPENVESLIELMELTRSLLGPAWASRATELAQELVALFENSPCLDFQRLREVDPEFAGLIAEAALRIDSGAGMAL